MPTAEPYLKRLFSNALVKSDNTLNVLFNLIILSIHPKSLKNTFNISANSRNVTPFVLVVKRLGKYYFTPL